MAMKVQIMHKEAIKPSSPTPDTLKILKLSLQDQFTPAIYIPLVLFYQFKDGAIDDHHKKSQKLKTSLSQTLTHFYPLAGRLKDNYSIECDDQGAEYIEARIGCSLSDILKEPDAEALYQYLPAAIQYPEAATENLLLVQATFFDCGGLAIGICVSHKVADAATVTTFIKCLSAIAIGSGEVVIPKFMADSIFPPMDLSMFPMNPVELLQKKCLTKRFVFDGSKIEALRAKAASTRVPKPTRVEAVSGLIWKAIITTLRSNLKLFRPSIWSVSVNMRSRFTPSLPENYAGNSVGHIALKILEGESEIELEGVVGRIRKELQEFGENYMKKIQGEEGVLAICGAANEFGNLVMSNEVDFYVCSSWCRFDLYGANFGWGRPIWLGIPNSSIRNAAVFVDTRDGDGIEVWLTLAEEEMALFESNEQLLEFAYVNPSVTSIYS